MHHSSQIPIHLLMVLDPILAFQDGPESEFYNRPVIEKICMSLTIIALNVNIKIFAERHKNSTTHCDVIGKKKKNVYKNKKNIQSIIRKTPK